MAAYRRVELGIAHVPEGRWIVRDMTADENLRIGALRRGRAQSARGPRTSLRPIPPPQGTPPANCGNDVGRRAADDRDRPRTDSEPHLLILDEPSFRLAPIVVRAALDAVRAVRDDGVAVLIVEQNVNIVLPMSDHAYVMENAGIAVQGSGSELMGDPEVARAYLGQ